jgi:hypothetical protein
MAEKRAEKRKVDVGRTEEEEQAERRRGRRRGRQRS